MRLTPSWLHPSSDTSAGECSEDGETSSGPQVTIYHEPNANSATKRIDADNRADEFLPDTDAALLAVLEEMQLPVTVDEITDRLIEPAQPSIDTWAAVHERLHQTRLPALDEADEIEFDDAQGIVDRPEPRADAGGLVSPAVFGAVSIIVLLTLLALVSLSVVTALTITVLTTTVVVWFGPGIA